MYVSNESQEPVYFDNLQVAHTRGRIAEETHYYSYGLQIAAISSRKVADPREGTLDNRYGYNDKELWDDADLNWLNYGFRNYDPQIGRFPQLDPLTFYYPHYTPYQFAGCEPIANVDVDGLEPANAIFTGVKMMSGGAAVVSRASDMAPLVLKAVKHTAKAVTTGNRIFGAVRVVGSLMEMAAGGVFGVGTSWTGVGGVLGAATVMHGADGFTAGVMQLWTGRETQSFTEQGISKGLQRAGVSKAKANVAAGYADATVGTVLSGGAGAMRNATFAVRSTLARSQPIFKSLGAASRAEMLAKKFKLNINSPTTRQVLNSLDDTVESFVSKYRKPSIRAELPGEFLKQSVEDALKSGNTTLRKLLIDSRFVK